MKEKKLVQLCVLLFCWLLIWSARKGRKLKMNSHLLNEQRKSQNSFTRPTVIVFSFSAAWHSFCPNTASTSFKLSWGTTWNKLCVSIASTLVINSVQTHQSDPIPPVPRSQLPCILSCGSYSGVSPLVLYYLFPSWSHNHSFVSAAQISGSPLCFSSVV